MRRTESSRVREYRSHLTKEEKRRVHKGERAAVRSALREAESTALATEPLCDWCLDDGDPNCPVCGLGVRSASEWFASEPSDALCVYCGGLDESCPNCGLRFDLEEEDDWTEEVAGETLDEYYDALADYENYDEEF